MLVWGGGGGGGGGGLIASLSIIFQSYHTHLLFIPRHFKKCGVLYPPFKKKRSSVCLSVRPSVSELFSLSAGSIFLPIFFKLAMRVDIGKECPGIADG